MNKTSVVIIILTLLLILTNSAWIVYNFAFKSTHKTYELLREFSGFPQNWKTGVFDMNAREWGVTVSDWDINYGYSFPNTTLSIAVNDAYTDVILQTTALDLNGPLSHYFNITGRFYLTVNASLYIYWIKIEIWALI